MASLLIVFKAVANHNRVHVDNQDFFNFLFSYTQLFLSVKCYFYNVNDNGACFPASLETVNTIGSVFLVSFD